jgi:hypothetical protein
MKIKLPAIDEFFFTHGYGLRGICDHLQDD